jgi:hypothetical protein
MTQGAAVTRYDRRLRHYERLRRRIERRSRVIANARLVAAGVAAALAFATWSALLPRIGYAASGAAAVAFVALVVWHDRVIRRGALTDAVAATQREARARTDGTWATLPADGRAFADRAHPWAADLDVFGHASLYQYLDATVTPRGARRLAAWLGEAAPPGVVATRQEAVRELAASWPLRHRVQATARLAGLDRASLDAFLAWLATPPYLAHRRALVWTARSLAPLTLGALAAWLWFGAPGTIVLAPLTVQVLLLARHGGAMARAYEPLLARHGPFAAAEDVLRLVEARRFASGALQAWQRRLLDGGERPSARMAALRRIVDALHLRLNMLHGAINALVLWDVHWLDHLERWVARSGARAPAWLDALADLEALSSLARVAHDEPHHCWPAVADDTSGPALEAEALGHPLIPPARRVCNDLALRGAGHIALVTGSNMSGKSTFLRTVGLNVVLAQAGAPCCARALALGACRLRTSMRIDDDLEAGVSYFYAEVRRLKAILDDATRPGPPVLAIFDELLRGTNTRERLIASRAVLRHLRRSTAMALVSTHDLALVELGGEHPAGWQDLHFRETIAEGRMHFDYTLRPGPVSSSNAIALLRLEGLDLDFE